MWRRNRRLSKEQELDEEIQAHLAIEVKKRIEAGETPEQAQQAARRQFGSVAFTKEATREMWGYNWLESCAQDLKYALRTLQKSPGFTTVGILTLALAIGANTAIFGLIDAALLRPLPFPAPDHLVRIYSTKNGASLGGPSAMDMRDFARTARSFTGMVIYDRWRKNVSGLGGSSEPEEMVVGLAPGSYFEVLGIKPLLGRLFHEEENVFGKHFVAAIGENFWKRRFGADPRILGRTLRINGEAYSIVAVMPDLIPAWMDGTTTPVAVWTPLALENLWTEAGRGDRGDLSVGRLKDGVSFEQALTELATIAAGLAKDHPVDRGISAAIEPLADTRSGPVRPIVLMLAAAVGVVLLIACSNLAGLLLARGSVRYREIAVRAALGADRRRLVRQLLTETLLLGLSGGAVGLVFSSLASAAILHATADSISPFTTSVKALPQFWSSGLEPRTLLFTFGISLITALLFGLAPAFSGTRISLSESLKEGGRGDAVGAARQSFRRMLVIAEIAMSLVLVVAAGLLVQSMIRLQQQNLGFRADHLWKAHFYLPPARYPEPAAITRFCDEFGRRLRLVPGVLDASVTTVYPPRIKWPQTFIIDGRRASRTEDAPVAEWGVTDSACLRTLGMQIVAGRDFADSDRADGLPVALLNEAFVQRYFAGQDPIGHKLSVVPPPWPVRLPGDAKPGADLTVVGVIRNFMNAGMSQPPAPQVLALFRQQPDFNFGFKDIVLRAAVEPASIAPAVQRVLRSLDPDLPLGEVQTMPDHLKDQIADTRFTTTLLSVFAGLGTILAVIGAYGVISYLVSQRTHELGVRKALGADSSEILWLVLSQGIRMGLAGIALGLAGVAVMQQFVRRLLFGISGTDACTLCGASLLILIVAAAASFMPARRAMRIDPIQALRNE